MRIFPIWVDARVRRNRVRRAASSLAHAAAETLYLPSVCLAELLFGVQALPADRRPSALAAAAEGLVKLFDGRILPFEERAARRYADITAAARAAGVGLSFANGCIAATAAPRGFSVATRDVAPFRAAGVEVIEPWAAGAGA